MTVSATNARQNLFRLVKKSIKRHEPVKITSKDGNVLLISEEDYEGLLETLELLSKPGFRKSIEEARSDIRAGKTKSLRDIFGR